MQKRYQVFLDDWLADYVRYLCREYDVSFSEVVRIILSVSAGFMVSGIHKKFEYGLDQLKLFKVAKDRNSEEMHKLISKIYFEARKAVEFKLSNQRSN